MCGIAGFQTFGPLPSNAAAIARHMGNALAHRGPDGSDEWLDPNAGVALAHRRLAIVDLSPAGQQPMRSACGRLILVFNGEIYNHSALRYELRERGRHVAWRGQSDTETLLAAIAAWGVSSALQRAVGMFALAVWDRQTRTLTLARDRLGEKPLYWGMAQGTLVFGSELKALRAHPAHQARVDRGALALLLKFGYIPAPWSIDAGMHKLPPGTVLRISGPADVDAAPEPYWSVTDAAMAGARSPLQLSPVEAADELDRLLRQSVAGQRMSDVPLGAFLSGGIDSTSTVAVMQALSSTPVQTFTIGLPDVTLDESAQARAIARHLGTQHTELMISPTEALSVIPRLPSLFCEPLADPSQVPTLLVSQLARRTVTVALTGDAGDELFGGYERYRWAQRLASLPLLLRRSIAALLRTMPATVWSTLLAPVSPLLPGELSGASRASRADRLRKLTRVLGAIDDDAVYRQMVSFWPDGGIPVLGVDEPTTAFSEPSSAWADFETRMMLLDMRSYLTDDILVKVDRAAMACSLETRVPLLDHRIIEFALRLPLEHKMRGGQGKRVLRMMLDRYVPPHLVNGPKKGFGIPIHAWLRGPLRSWAGDLLDGHRLRKSGLIDAAPVVALWQQHLAGRHDWGYRLWPVLMFEAWREAQGELK